MASAVLGDDMVANRMFGRPLADSEAAYLPLQSQHSILQQSRNDRWSVSLNAPGVARCAGKHVDDRSLMMPLSTGCHSLVASTTTLPSVLETGDHGLISSYNTSSSSSTGTSSRTLRPQPHPNTSSNPFRAFVNDSTTSSPSTTTSTLNSAVTESSPVSSPQSPSSLLQFPFRQLKNPSATVTSENKDAPMEQSQRRDDVSPVRPSTSMSDSAALKKGRNMKNLSINTNGISAKQSIDTRTAKTDLAPRPSTQAGPAPPFRPGNLPAVSESAPASPSFIIPKMPPRRKPSKLGLTIATPDTDQKAVVPPTPSFGATFAMRQSNAPTPLQTIPQTPAFPPPPLNLTKPTEPESEPPQPTFTAPPVSMQFQSVTGRELRTPGLAPLGGMTLPPFGSADNSPSKRSSPGAERPSGQDPLELQRHRSADVVNGDSSIVNRTIEHVNRIPSYDRPLSQEVKSPSYPNGPACIYPPNVFLYHQPTANEARDFDVIINVAREVSNPFEVEAEEEKARIHAKNTEPVKLSKPSYRSVGVQTELLTDNYPPRSGSPEDVPDTAASETCFHDALERLSMTPDDDAPATPRGRYRDPEYIHLPWEHNSKVYEEWFEICKLIDERVRVNKKVLIHCQLGVSRSASLIVAYGIFQNPRLSPDEAREQAKNRSRWIDLNMHFMYELGDFKKLLAKKGIPGAEVPRSGPTMGSKPAMLALSRSKTDSAMLSPVISMPPTPLSAVSNGPGSAPLDGEEAKNAQFATVLESGLQTPGPSSAPADVTWTPSKGTEGVAEGLPILIQPSEKVGLPHPISASQRLPPPMDLPQRQPSPSLKTPALEMPGGWAKTPADSRPASMVFPGSEVEDRSGEKTPTGSSPMRTPELAPEAESTKPKRTPSFRGLPKMPSFPSSLNSLFNAFSLNRSASTSSKRSASPGRSAPRRGSSYAPPAPAAQPPTDSAPSGSTLKKPPSLPTLRTFFPSQTSPKPTLTLETIPQSAVAVSQDEDLAALMSPRAQEFVTNPFHRPMTSHHAMTGMTIEPPPPLAGLTVRRQRSGQSLRSLNPTGNNSVLEQQPSNGGVAPASGAFGLGGVDGASARRTSGGQASNLEADDVRELLSPGAQARDPRSPPSTGNWGTEERVMRNIDDVL